MTRRKGKRVTSFEAGVARKMRSIWRRTRRRLCKRRKWKRKLISWATVFYKSKIAYSIKLFPVFKSRLSRK